MNVATPEPFEEAGWFEQALAALADAGSTGQASAECIRRRRVPFRFSRQKHTGASWFNWRRLCYGGFLNANFTDRQPDDPHLCSLLAHEAKHLEQGMVEALSVRGELIAWQLQYDVLVEFSVAPDHLWQQLYVLDPDSRSDLERARALMKQIAGPGYRIDWLPLWPLPAEVAHRLKGLGRWVGEIAGWQNAK